jgi:nucleoside-diphosphate-sugar epimerase
MDRILVTGALGQIGSELVPALRERHGADRVVASDLKPAPGDEAGPFERLDCNDAAAVRDVVERHEIGAVYHLAALLSAVAERRPQDAWNLNVDALYDLLELARERGLALFVPSSIAAFGPSTPRRGTPQDTVQRPNTMYGVTKVTGELLCDYYHRRWGVDVRGVRFPGLISYAAPPGGGTTDYAVDIFHAALSDGRYTCFLEADTRLDMMYMPDAIRAILELMAADPGRLEHRNAFNLTAMQLTPDELAAEIRRHLPDFRIEYEPDPVRQRIADSWPDSLDDSEARRQWGWSHEYDLPRMVADMLENLRARGVGAGEEEHGLAAKR